MTVPGCLSWVINSETHICQNSLNPDGTLKTCALCCRKLYLKTYTHIYIYSSNIVQAFHSLTFIDLLPKSRYRAHRPPALQQASGKGEPESNPGLCGQPPFT